jgi:16S rRNA (cytosine1402-N4)-methyltransferase
MKYGHQPVMLAEVLKALQPRSGGTYVDGTLGAGGHAEAVLEASSPNGRLIGFDRDQSALDLAAGRLAPFGERVSLIPATYDQIGIHLQSQALSGADGILLDLGVSSMQLDQPQRGFSFRHEAPLDMRMGSQGETAADLLMRLKQKELTRILGRYGEEPFARRISARLVKERADSPIDTTAKLASLVEAALPAKARRQRKRHPATRVFQALRIAVNDELGQLERFLDEVPGWLNPGGMVCIISYHSLEDRLVKKSLRQMADPCTCPPDLPICACGKKPLVSIPIRKGQVPGRAEISLNPRARSARMRYAVRTKALA